MEINYKGHTALPSDYECQDGQLAIAMNAVPQYGGLRAVQRPKVIAHIPNGYKLLFYHNTASFKHYILLRLEDNAICWTTNFVDIRLIRTTISDIQKVEAIGNTLLMLTPQGMHYLLWKGDTQNYLYLGTHIPELPLSFGLQGEMIRTDEFVVYYNAIHENDLYKELTDENKIKVSEQVLSKVNKFIADESTKKGRFLFPFFVRYAYRLYDGSLTMHSAPILMVASTDIAPQVFCTYHIGTNNYSDHLKMYVAGAFHKLDYAVLQQGFIDGLENWKDIIQSVEIFCSKPIYTYDQSGKIEAFRNNSEMGYCVTKHINQTVSASTHPQRYQKRTYAELYGFTFSPNTLDAPSGRLALPRKSQEAVYEEIRETAQFYLLDSIKIENLTTTRTILEIPNDYLQSLVNREVMNDDYDSHDTLVPGYAFNYNSRVNLANLKKIIFNGYNTASQVTHTDGYVEATLNSNPTANDGTSQYAIFVYIRDGAKNIVVKADSGMLSNKNPSFLFFYYPNPNAYKAVIQTNTTFGAYHYEVKLQRHKFLNGAFFFNGWENSLTQMVGRPVTSSLEERTIEISNKIYTSAVNNPFLFPLLGINTVGTGEIIGISSAAKALSQGQFGQFPLYAFSTDGVWALEVSSTGGYSAKQPITRDVCTDANGITQMDSAVLFPTHRGMMLLSGSQAQCISEVIDNVTTQGFSNIPKFKEILTLYNKATPTNPLPLDLAITPFREFITKARIVYDYVHQRIIIANPDQPYAYVFSLHSKEWGMMQADIKEVVNAYPAAQAINHKSQLVDYSQEGSQTTSVFLLSRPFKLGDPNKHKTINSMILRGVFKRGALQQVLYGSNDLHHWQIVWSSTSEYLQGMKGTPYKYFRLVIVGEMLLDDMIHSSSIEAALRLTNKMR